MVYMLQVKKDRLEEVRNQLKKYAKDNNYNNPMANMLKAERDSLKKQIKEIESCRSWLIASRIVIIHLLMYSTEENDNFQSKFLITQKIHI